MKKQKKPLTQEETQTQIDNYGKFKFTIKKQQHCF